MWPLPETIDDIITALLIGVTILCAALAASAYADQRSDLKSECPEYMVCQ